MRRRPSTMTTASYKCAHNGKRRVNGAVNSGAVKNGGARMRIMGMTLTTIATPGMAIATTGAIVTAATIPTGGTSSRPSSL